MPRRPIIRRALAALAAASLLAPALPTAAHATQNWPLKPIRIIVPNPPAGPSDIAIRPLAAAVQKALGQPVIVENRAGANGNIGAAEVARAAADGYTWLWAMDPVLTVNKHIYKNIGYSSDAIVVLNAAARFSQTLICNPKLGFKSVKDMIDAAKTRELTYATGGAGSPGHLVMESLLSTTGVKMVHIPYKGPAPAMQDLMGGQVDCGFLAAPTVLPQIQSGRVTALATSGKQRSTLMPQLPTIAESGYPEFDGTFWLFLAAPKGVPADIQKRFLEAMEVAIRSPEQQDRVKPVDIEMVGSTADQAQQKAKELSGKWEALTRKIQLKAE
ncbi:Bug family tripartite tricarboxylate transporter substrate binding protein [Comamonas resistens]|uniref:Tripartite tricarboxylate transporter substrate binding protein n=1 Tax=Comamonas resistens TaxID=3046670 RepID=A0ABY8SV68_9BURK|nr:tripartite tricarboxylate transporter substrate binding protein [Comamonas resistens]MDL5037016.1 tripartite tricarboxylate transporter substrate binding protein [Comamonas resistens]WHS65779.1 tripartite tricarboxylate transporter substrate binding protein [Comamonas resistens]